MLLAVGAATGTAGAIGAGAGGMAAATGMDGGTGVLVDGAAVGAATATGVGVTGAGTTGTWSVGAEAGGGASALRAESPPRVRRRPLAAGLASLAAGSLLGVGGAAAGSTATLGATASLATLAFTSGVAGSPPSAPRPERRRLPPRWSFAGVPLASAFGLLTFSPSALTASPRSFRSGYVRSPKMPGLTRTRSADGRLASIKSRVSIIASGSRPTTESRLCLMASRVSSFTWSGFPSRRRIWTAASTNVIASLPKTACRTDAGHSPTTVSPSESSNRKPPFRAWPYATLPRQVCSVSLAVGNLSRADFVSSAMASYGPCSEKPKS